MAEFPGFMGMGQVSWRAPLVIDIFIYWGYSMCPLKNNLLFNSSYRRTLCQGCCIPIESPIYYLDAAFCSSECLHEWLEDTEFHSNSGLEKIRFREMEVVADG